MRVSRRVLLCLIMKTLLLAEVAVSHQNLLDITYEDLVALNATCEDLDSCKKERPKEDIPSYNCLCGEFCSQSNTCCIDSKHRKQYPLSRNKYNCVTVYGSWPNSVYMIDTCDYSWSGDKSVEELCTSNGEDLDDLFLLAPVTNIASSATYKNYFCSVCNNDAKEEELVFWKLSLTSKSKEVNRSTVPEMHYNSSSRRWELDISKSKEVVNSAVPEGNRSSVSHSWEQGNSKHKEDMNSSVPEMQYNSNPYRREQRTSKSKEAMTLAVPEVNHKTRYRRWELFSENPTTFLVKVKFVAPDQLKGLIFECLDGIISECAPNWVDTAIKEKCHSYMALVDFFKEGRLKIYQNPHCALCNFEKLEERNCILVKPIVSVGLGSDTFFVRLFSLYDKENKCGDDMVYDTIAKKCRRVFKG